MPLDKPEFLWRMFDEHMTQSRQQESLRSSVTTMLITLSAVVVGFITFDKELSRSDLPASFLLSALGVFGALFAAKHYERFMFHIARARAYRDEIERLFADTDWTALREQADAKHRAEFPRLVDMRQHRFWVIFHCLIAFVGAILSGIILFG
jgi:hypothetical protein